MTNPFPGFGPNLGSEVPSHFESPALSNHACTLVEQRLSRIARSPYFASPISETRLRPCIGYLHGDLSSVHTVVGVGCAQRVHEGSNTRCVPSAAVPVDSLGMIFRARHLNEALGIPNENITLVIGSGAAKCVLPKSAHGEVDRISAWHRSVAENLKAAGIGMTILVDEHIFESPVYRKAEQDRLRVGPDTDAYGVTQDATIKYLYDCGDVRFKMGWTNSFTPTSFGERAVHQSGGCEGEHDTRTLAFQRAYYGTQVVGFAYGPGGSASSSRYETAIPYVIPAQSSPFRIQLKKGEPVASKVPQISSTRGEKFKILARSIRRYYELCELADEVLKGTLPPVPAELRAQINDQRAEMVSKQRDTARMACRQRELRQTRECSGEIRDELSHLKRAIREQKAALSASVIRLACMQRDAVIPRLQKLVNEVGVRAF